MQNGKKTLSQSYVYNDSFIFVGCGKDKLILSNSRSHNQLFTKVRYLNVKAISRHIIQKSSKHLYALIFHELINSIQRLNLRKNGRIFPSSLSFQDELKLKDDIQGEERQLRNFSSENRKFNSRLRDGVSVHCFKVPKKNPSQGPSQICYVGFER